MSSFYDRLVLGKPPEDVQETEPAEQKNAPAAFVVENKPVTCSHCEGQKFSMGTAQLNTAGMTFLHLDWADNTAHTLLCANCGHIEWFAQEPTRLS